MHTPETGSLRCILYDHATWLSSLSPFSILHSHETPLLTMNKAFTRTPPAISQTLRILFNPKQPPAARLHRVCTRAPSCAQRCKTRAPRPPHPSSQWSYCFCPIDPAADFGLSHTPAFQMTHATVCADRPDERRGDSPLVLCSMLFASAGSRVGRDRRFTYPACTGHWMYYTRTPHFHLPVECGQLPQGPETRTWKLARPFACNVVLLLRR